MRVAFILNQHNANLKSRGVLFSIHDEDVPVFRLLRLRARRAPGLIEDAKEVLLKLFDADAGILGRHAGEHLRRARRREQTGAGWRRDRHPRAKCWPPLPARKT